MRRYTVYVCSECGHQAYGLYAEETIPCSECGEGEYAAVEAVAISDLAKWLREQIADAYKENSPGSAPKIIVCMALRDLLEGGD